MAEISPPKAPSKGFFLEQKKLYLAVIVLSVLSFASFLWWREYVYPYESTDDANIEGVVIDVSPEQAGKIARLYKEEGESVKKGDLLFEIDNTLLVVQKERAKAFIAHALDLVGLQQIKADLAEQDFKRAEIEYNQEIISTEMYEHVKKAWEGAKAELQAICSQVLVEEASLRLIQTQLDQCKVYAPSDGVIAKRWHFPGDLVREGQTVLSLFDLSQIWITARLEETKLAAIHLHDPVKISIDTYPDVEFTGSVLMVGAAAASQFSLIPSNNASGNFTKVTQRIPLRISLNTRSEGQPLYLRPGMSAEVKIKTR